MGAVGGWPGTELSRKPRQCPGLLPATSSRAAAEQWQETGVPGRRQAGERGTPPPTLSRPRQEPGRLLPRLKNPAVSAAPERCAGLGSPLPKAPRSREPTGQPGGRPRSQRGPAEAGGGEATTERACRGGRGLGGRLTNSTPSVAGSELRRLLSLRHPAAADIGRRPLGQGRGGAGGGGGKWRRRPGRASGGRGGRAGDYFSRARAAAEGAGSAAGPESPRGRGSLGSRRPRPAPCALRRRASGSLPRVPSPGAEAPVYK